MGIDLLSTMGKTCTFDCIYCQLGRTLCSEIKRREFVSLDSLVKELKRVESIAADYATFSGMGEPTLASNLGEAIELVKSILKLPVAVLTNSSLLTGEDVRHELYLADVVVAKVDAPNEELFRKINRPVMGLTLGEIIKALKLFREKYRGKFALQMMFVETNKSYAFDMAKIAEQLSPDEVQINTPLRPCGVSPLSPAELASAEREFGNLENVVTVYTALKPEVKPFDLAETLRRRPKL